MHIAIKLLDELSVGIGKKEIIVKVSGPVSVKKLYEMAANQEKKVLLAQKLEGFMVCYKGTLLDYEQAMKKELLPGEEIVLLPLMDGG